MLREWHHKWLCRVPRGEILGGIMLLPVNNKRPIFLSQFLSPFIVCCIPAKNAKSLIKELSKYFTQKIFFNKSFQQFSMSRWCWSKDGKYLTILNKFKTFFKVVFTALAPPLWVSGFPLFVSAAPRKCLSADDSSPHVTPEAGVRAVSDVWLLLRLRRTLLR